MMKRSNVGERRRDLISDLPTSVLHLILSFLPDRDAATTSVLSKQWNFTRNSYPVLVFAQPSKLGKYLDYVDNSLHYFVQRKLRIERMTLNLSLQASDVLPVVDTWLPLALHSGVSKIMFNISSHYNYPLPETTFVVNDSPMFFRLQNLRLNRVILSENMVRDIIRNCPNLADLNLCRVGGLKTLDIPKPNKLVNLRISKGEGIHDVSVDAPSLNHFSIELDNPRRRGGAIDMTSCCNIRRLELVRIPFTCDLLNVHISRFPILEFLHISNCDLLERSLRVSLQRLKHLRIVHCHNIKAIEIDAPNLSRYEFISGVDRLPRLLVSPNITSCSMDLVHPVHLDRFYSLSFFFLRQYLSNAPFKSTTLTLMCTPEYENDQEVRFNTDGFRDFIIPPLVEVDCLDLSYLPTRYSSCWPSMLEGFMWICHPKSVTMPNAADQWIEIFCKMVMGSRCLKTAKIESIGGIAINWKSTGGIEHKQFRCLLRMLSAIPRDGTIVFKLEWDHSAIQGLELV